MMRGMYAAISGLEAHQTMLDVTANNLANVDTVAFKAQRTTFVDELSQLVRAAGSIEAVHALERALAHGTATSQSLEEMQRLLAAEADEPQLLIAARGAKGAR